MREDQLTGVFEVLAGDDNLNLGADFAAHRHRGQKPRQRQADSLCGG